MSRRCSWLMASWGCHTRTDFQYGQGKETIWWAPYLQQRKEIQTRPSTLLFHYAEQCSANGSLLRLDEQLCRSFQLQVLPAVPCVHSHLIKLGMLCDVECSLRPSLRARHNSDHCWMRWIGWTASFSADSFPVLPHLDAVQKHDDHRILWKDGGGTLRLAIWHGGLGQPAKRLGRKCSFVVSTSALYAWEWNRMAKGELLDEVIRFNEGFRRWVSWSSAAWRSKNPYVCMKVGKADAERYPHDWADSCMQHVPHAEQALDWLNARPWLPLMFQGQSAKPGNLDKAWPVTFHDILAETWGLKFKMQRIQNMQTAEVRNLLTWEFGSFWRSLAWCWRWGAVSNQDTKQKAFTWMVQASPSVHYPQGRNSLAPSRSNASTDAKQDLLIALGIQSLAVQYMSCRIKDMMKISGISCRLLYHSDYGDCMRLLYLHCCVLILKGSRSLAEWMFPALVGSRQLAWTAQTLV